MGAKELVSMGDIAIVTKLVRAQSWTTDASPQVRAWANALADELQRTHELHAAREEYESRRWGT